MIDFDAIAMITDRDLLLRAWPLGYLPMRGVLTVGGWTFAGTWTLQASVPSLKRPGTCCWRAGETFFNFLAATYRR